MDKPTLRRRAAGVLLHPTSLPGPHGAGDLGAQAQLFAARLAACGQTWWQMLPVGPTGAGDSPYHSDSSFAGSPMLLSLERLREQGLLEPADMLPERPLRASSADFAAARRFKEPRLRKAFVRWEKKAGKAERAKFEEFCRAQSAWLQDYALFRAIKAAVKGKPWTAWEAGLRERKTSALEKAARELSASVRLHCFLQWQFERQWSELKARCGALGVGLIGDIPIYVAHDSADVWAEQGLFHLGPDGEPVLVAGVPPDYFSKTGQLWGNPLYRWDVMAEGDYAWWLSRLRLAWSRFDVLRLDHFIGFRNYWEIPAGAGDATLGRWAPGPGEDFFEKVRAYFPGAELIAEDLGVVTPAVAALRDRFDLPGIRVLQFSFSTWDEARQPHRWPERAVAYTGTHDNDTTAGWFAAASAAEKDEFRRYTASDGDFAHYHAIRAVYGSVADLAVVPMQDALGLGSEARMNTPGVAEGNWRWKLRAAELGEAPAKMLHSLAETFGRLPTQKEATDEEEEEEEEGKAEGAGEEAKGP